MLCVHSPPELGWQQPEKAGSNFPDIQTIWRACRVLVGIAVFDVRATHTYQPNRAISARAKISPPEPEPSTELAKYCGATRGVEAVVHCILQLVGMRLYGVAHNNKTTRELYDSKLTSDAFGCPYSFFFCARRRAFAIRVASNLV